MNFLGKTKSGCCRSSRSTKDENEQGLGLVMFCFDGQNSRHLHAKTCTKAPSTTTNSFQRNFCSASVQADQPCEASSRFHINHRCKGHLRQKFLTRSLKCFFTTSQEHRLVKPGNLYQHGKHAVQVVDHKMGEKMSKAKRNCPTGKSRDRLEAQIRCTGTSNRATAFASRPTRLDVC